MSDKRTSPHGAPHRHNKNAQPSTGKPCAWPDCAQEGAYRAPKSRTQLNEYHWYCLTHIRERNKSWNYFAGLNEQEVEAQVRHDTVWNRPTWKMGGIGPRAFDAARQRFSDAFGGFEGDARRRTRGDDARPPKAPPSQARALAVLDLDPTVTMKALKSRYKSLVKRHHPDANNGDKRSEEKFKQIVEAYQIIRKSLGETAS
ncbi:J domain-containing protein [Varunaivibrio sulfuroxidans]|uniref:DnaJ-like protein n=1 Tax=Varunaivibrio sulfuroxidans TaxID=1773489 RepID=A0A4R3JCM4_9PROT|nr:DnaJ domain-containing protein [Varunaivibrio sulfuroxidans]TCS63512.1 DnaJ-like protein [Varunaivibrio sulfuroxidans]WES30343.1 DnaJ domain-containing protein [Varunaivibrio sulfuroxidans]